MRGFLKPRRPSGGASTQEDERRQRSYLPSFRHLDTSNLTVEQRLDYLQSEVTALHQRNFEKDRGKEFEGSYARVIFLMVVTYLTLYCYMQWVLKTDFPYLDAIVPTVGFNISTWSLPFVKEYWIQARHYYRHGETEAVSLRREIAMLRAESTISRNNGQENARRDNVDEELALHTNNNNSQSATDDEEPTDEEPIAVHTIDEGTDQGIELSKDKKKEKKTATVQFERN